MAQVGSILLPGSPIMLVGQAPGSEEVLKGKPFVGPAGRELDRWLRAANVAREELSISNVWDREIPVGGLAEMTASSKEMKNNGWEARGGPIRGRHLRPEWWDGVDRLAAEIEAVRPKIVVALGNEALWAISGHLGIGDWRGTLMQSRLGWERKPGPKMLATWHPAGILRGGWSNRPLAIADLIKAVGEAKSYELVLPARELIVSPTLEEMEAWWPKLLEARVIGVDIETVPSRRMITSVAVAPSSREALCVPFVVGDRSYWGTVDEEIKAWKWVRRACELPNLKVLQNGLYDAQWLWEVMGIRLVNYREDTRLLHHALFPELPKSLGFMGSMWENEGAWKMLGAGRTKKRDD